MIAEDLELVPQAEPERRSAPRPEPPAPTSLSPRMRQIVDWNVHRLESSRSGWVVFLLICAACVGFIVWNMTARFDAFDTTYELITERVALEQQFDELTEHYSGDELRTLLDKISSAENTIFSDYASLAAWLAEQAQVARDEALILTYVMHETVAAQIKDVGEVPISLKVRPKEGHDGDTYFRMLNFLRKMVGTHWHLEIIDASIASDGQSVTTLDTTVHVWVDAAHPVRKSEL